MHESVHTTAFFWVAYVAHPSLRELQRPHKQHRVCKCPAGIPDGAAAKPAYPPNVGYGISEEEGDMPFGTPLQKGTVVARLLAAKEASGKTFSQIAAEVGLTNVYCTQLFYNQVRPLQAANTS